MSRGTEASVYFPLPRGLMMLLDNHFDTPFFTCIVCPGAGGGRCGGMRAICGTYNVSLRNSKRSSAQASLTRVSMRPLSVCAFTTTARVRTDISPEHPHTALELFPILARFKPWKPADPGLYYYCYYEDCRRNKNTGTGNFPWS